MGLVRDPVELRSPDHLRALLHQAPVYLSEVRPSGKVPPPALTHTHMVCTGQDKEQHPLRGHKHHIYHHGDCDIWAVYIQKHM